MDRAWDLLCERRVAERCLGGNKKGRGKQEKGPISVDKGAILEVKVGGVALLSLLVYSVDVGTRTAHCDAQRERALSGTDIKLIMPPQCPHGRRRYVCKECGGGGICEHGRQRHKCKECGGSGICEHGRQRSKCKECGGSRQETILLEATAVEVDEDAEPDERIPTVQSYIVVAAGPRGGKRKR